MTVKLWTDFKNLFYYKEWNWVEFTFIAMQFENNRYAGYQEMWFALRLAIFQALDSLFEDDPEGAQAILEAAVGYAWSPKNDEDNEEEEDE